MKPQLPTPALMLLITFFILSSTQAQQIVMNKPVQKNADCLIEHALPKIPSKEITSHMLNNFNMNARRNFATKYNDVSNASWYFVEGGFVAKFMSGEAVTTVTYNKSGDWLYTIKSYGEKSMLKDVREVVKSTYYDYNIVHVEEIEVPLKDSPIYLVYVQDATNIKVLRVDDGELQVLHDYIIG